jgi:sirohydrochlorin ferrochelatase
VRVFSMKTDGQITGIILFAHGSSVEEANRGVHALATELRTAGPYEFVRAAFLELAHPDLGEAIAEAVNAGATRVVVIPFFLTMGVHLRRDLPNLIAPERRKHPQLSIEVAPSLEGHPLMSTLILERVGEALRASEGRE